LEKIRKSTRKTQKSLHEKIDELKKQEIKKALEEYKGNKTKAAKELDISRRDLIKMIKGLKL